MADVKQLNIGTTAYNIRQFATGLPGGTSTGQYRGYIGFNVTSPTASTQIPGYLSNGLASNTNYIKGLEVKARNDLIEIGGEIAYDATAQPHVPTHYTKFCGVGDFTNVAIKGTLEMGHPTGCRGSIIIGSGITDKTGIYNSISIGRGDTITSSGCVSIGYGAKSSTNTSVSSVSIGYNADCSGAGYAAIGSNTTARYGGTSIGLKCFSLYDGIAMGYNSNASNYGVAIGTSTTGNYRGIAIGYGAQATTNSINLGDSQSAEYSVVIGVHDTDHRPSINTGSIMIGSNFTDTYDDSDGSVNSDNMVTGVGAIAIGSGYYTDDYDYDPPAIASGNYSISIGHSTVSGLRGVGVGGSAYEYGTAVGGTSHASGSGVAYGYGAICNNKYGIAIGRDAKCYGTATDSSYANIAIGYNANLTHTNYWKRIAIGTNATIGNFDNSAIIGTGAVTAGSQFLIGQSMKIYCASTSIVSTSDRRDKTDIRSVNDSILPFIKDLNPVTFLWNRREDYIEEVKDVENYSEEKCSDEEKEQHNKYLHNQKIRETFGFDSNAVNKEKYKEETHRGKRRQIGFIAQDVLQSMKKHFGDDDNKYLLVNSNLYDLTENHDMEETVVDGVKQESLLTMEYSNFIPLIIKAMQEQQKLIEEQEKRIVELENRLNNILK